jgi:acetyltransferase-like isoleucine patch superfamily enzyme
MRTSFLTDSEAAQLGLAHIGHNVKISRLAQFYGDKIRIGDNSRIDDFCILSGVITIGSFVHISAYTAIYGSHGVDIGDFAGLSPRCTIFSASDDFSGNFMVGPTINAKYTNVTGGLVKIGKYAQLGAGTTVFPSINIGEGTAIGAMSLVNRNVDSWKIAFGIPVKIKNDRSKQMLEFIRQLPAPTPAHE